MEFLPDIHILAKPDHFLCWLVSWQLFLVAQQQWTAVSLSSEICSYLAHSISHYGHFFESLHQLWGALAAIIIHPHSWYEEIIFSFELCDHTYQVKSCNRFLWKSPQRPLSRHFLATKNEKWKIEKLWAESRHFSFLAITWSVFIQINQTRFQMKVCIYNYQ